MKNLTYNSLNWNTFLKDVNLHQFEKPKLHVIKKVNEYQMAPTGNLQFLSWFLTRKALGTRLCLAKHFLGLGPRDVQGCFQFGYRIVRNVFGHLWTSSEVFGKLRICLCHLRISWYSPVKNLTPLTQKKLAGIQCHCNTVIGKSHFGLKRGALLVSGMVGVTLWWTRASGLGIQVGIEILQQVTSCCQNHKRSEKHIFDGPLGFQQRLSPLKFTTLLTNYFSRAFLHDCICTR